MDGIRICPNCRTENSVNEIMCVRCMTDLSNVEISSTQKQNDITQVYKIVKLALQNEEFTMVFEPDNEYILGRHHEGKTYFEKIPYVSRRHAKIFFKDGVWYIEDLGSTNHTYINGKKIEKPSPISEGDKVALSSSVVFIAKFI